MNDRNPAVIDPSIDSAELAELAHLNPHLRAAAVFHPSVYPGLLDWLRDLGDPTVADAISHLESGHDADSFEWPSDAPATSGALNVDVDALKAADPLTDAADLVAIAEVRYDLHATIALNPAAYDGLLDWIAAVASIDNPADRGTGDTESPADREYQHPALDDAVDEDATALLVRFVARGQQLVDDLALHLLYPLPHDVGAMMVSIANATTALRQAYTTRWGADGFNRQFNGTGSGANGPATLHDLQSLRTRVLAQKIPKASQARDELRAAELDIIGQAHDVSVNARWSAIEEVYSAWLSLANSDSTNMIFRDAVAELGSIIERLDRALPQGVDDLAPRDGSVSTDPLVRMGALHSQGVTADYWVPSRSNGVPSIERTRHDAGATLMRAPYGRPLSTWPSSVTDSKNSIVSFIVQALAALPPRQLRATIFDPLQLGDSVRPLYALGEQSAEIWGDKVFTSANELGTLLSEIENHITLVTQKYLGSEYETLHAYNKAAGEVAEPYRVLTLFDFPSGFVSGQGYWNDELIERLEKIVRTGTRCGVITLIHADSSQLNGIRTKLSDVPEFISGSANHMGWANSTKENPASTSAGFLAGTGSIGQSINSHLVWEPERNPDDAGVSDVLLTVEKRLLNSHNLAIGVEAVARLAVQSHQTAHERGLVSAATLPVPGEPESWWHHSSAQGVTAAFGRLGAAGVAEFTLDSKDKSHALIGGRPGSGKSVLLHALIHDLTSRYSPEEMELYLLDFKQGVEFTPYATEQLPHARVVAVDAEREFGLSVLLGLEKEVSRRGELFRGTGSEQVNLAGMRSTTDEPLPRIVAIIDEFHVIFEQDDAISRRAGAVLELLIRQGRAFGIHCVLASQSLSGVNNIGAHVLNLIPVRIALASNDADSRALLADDNGDARLLTRPGEGILNNNQGKKDSNQRFQSFYTEVDERRAHIALLREKAATAGYSRVPVVFDGQKSVPLGDHLETAFPVEKASGLAVPVGLPLTLGPATFAQLRREPGSNLLIVSGVEEASAILTSTFATSWRDEITMDVFDFTGEGSPIEADAQHFALLPSSSVTVHPRRKMASVLAEVRAEVMARIERDDFGAPARIVVVSAVHRARNLDPEDYDEASELNALRYLALNGPEVGIHLVLWTESWSSFKRRIPGSILSEFNLRLVGQLNEEDSQSIIDSSAATTLRPFQLILDDFERSTSLKIRGFGPLEAPVLSATLAHRD